jgi:predicted kinase
MGLAARHLADGRVRLVLVGGLPGTGKSTLAAALADRFGAALLQTDVVRGELSATGELPRPAGDGREPYTPAARATVYANLLGRARHRLARGASVVLDASWAREEDRQAARRLAESTRSTLVEMRCAVAPATAVDRLRRRLPDVSDPGAALAARLAAGFDAWPTAVTVPTERPFGSVLDAARAVVVHAGPPS